MLTFQTRNPKHVIWKNHEAQFSINQILNEIGIVFFSIIQKD